MKNIHLNLGLSLIKPYESHYSTIRRFYIANRGIPFGVNENILRKKAPTTDGRSTVLTDARFINFFLRIKALHQDAYKDKLSPGKYFYTSIERHCPQCAHNLYHTDVYNCTWLERCPIHHCDFVMACPECHKPWPSLEEMWKRHCVTCGNLLASNITDTPSYNSITKIYEFINKNLYTNKTLHSNDQRYTDVGRSDWYHLMDYTHPSFGSFQASYQSVLSRKQIDALHIKSKPENIKVFKLKYQKDIFWESEFDNTRYKRTINLIDNPYSLVLSDFSVMRRILELFKNYINKKHVLHLYSYRYITFENLLKGPPPCPFCLSLSLWFYNIASQKYGYDYWMDIKEFPLLEGAHFGSMLWVPDVGFLEEKNKGEHISSTARNFSLTSRFTNWFYRRGLEIAFVEIFLFVKELLVRLQGIGQKSSETPSIWPDQYYLANRIKDRLIVVYENEHPIEQLAIPRIPYNAAKCKQHHNYLKDITYKKAFLDLTIQTNDFTITNFYKLHQCFVNHLENRISFNYPYMSPIFTNQAEYESLLEDIEERRKRMDTNLAKMKHELKRERDHSKYITTLKRIEQKYQQKRKIIEESYALCK